MKISPLGDSALTLTFSGQPKAKGADLLSTARAAKAAIDQAKIEGVLETVSSYESVTVFLDPLVPLRRGIDVAQVAEWFHERLLAATHRLVSPGKKAGHEIEVPVCFDEEFAPDLSELAVQSGMTAETFIGRFCAAKYEVACVGFSPGFPYLSGLPTELNAPRRPVPRTSVPAGSVAIGGQQAGIYPMISPGGWNVIGRTPLRLFNPSKDPPSLFSAGDRARFQPINRSEFDRAAQAT